ncbi:probable E3 ubiquitin-protein ligase MARCHF10 [Gracilinanus agilis]|uniref:probable E3 ubiquitin-protein ligase MARCHF10 n=1 Tax=Gracilinanus agilis TaxID=191870 RepID=UPI001CFDF9A3|nr:probable E3 ubiquitin-protein ligase MARCHF10 [Gracilinanus agilis]
MMHEARDRQKFVNDAQYLRDMQHKVDSEYQACLRRQEKKRDQFCRQEASFERPRPSSISISSSRQNLVEEDLGPEQRISITSKASVTKSESKLPAIDQTSVKQKQKVATSSKKPEKNVGGTSKPSPPAQAQILSRKKRPNLGRLTVSPEMQSRRPSGDRNRQISSLQGKEQTPRGPDSVGQQEVWSNETKMKRQQTRERRNLVPSSQLNADQKTPEKVSKDWTALSPAQPSLPLSPSFQGANGSQALSETSVPSLTSTSTVQPRRASVRFRDEDFYSFLELNTINAIGGNEDPEEVTRLEEEFLLAGIQPPFSPFNNKNIGLGRLSGTQIEIQNCEEELENSRPSSVKRTESGHRSSRKSNLMDPAPEQSLLGQRLPRDHKIPDGDSTKENDCVDDEGEKASFNSWSIKSENRQENCLNGETLPNDCSFVETRPGNHTYNRDRQSYGNSPRNSFDCFPPNRSTVHRPLLNSSYNTPRSLLHSTQRAEVPANLALTPVALQGSDSEGNSRFNGRRPLSPIRSRNPSATSEKQDASSPITNASEFDVKEIEDKDLTSQPPETSLDIEYVLQNSQDGSSSMDPPGSPPLRMNFRGHLHMSEPMQEEIPFTFFAVSDLPNQIEAGNIMVASDSINAKENHQTKADPDKLKKLQESLLEEDSEEEGDLCRICQIAGGSPTNPLLEPCGCVGSLQFVHQECLKKWLKVKITSGADLGAVKTCEMCKQGLIVDLDDFNVNDYYRKHQQSRAQNELMNSGLYLVLLLHLYEQRFAELMRLNYNRAARERVSRKPSEIRIQEMVMKTVYSKATAGSSNKEGGRGAQ